MHVSLLVCAINPSDITYCLHTLEAWSQNSLNLSTETTKSCVLFYRQLDEWLLFHVESSHHRSNFHVTLTTAIITMCLTHEDSCRKGKKKKSDARRRCGGLNFWQKVKDLSDFSVLKQRDIFLPLAALLSLCVSSSISPPSSSHPLLQLLLLLPVLIAAIGGSSCGAEGLLWVLSVLGVCVQRVWAGFDPAALSGHSQEY